MRLSVIIQTYRSEQNISQREFAKRCGLSNSYISFIEKEANPRTGRPMVPTLEQYKKLADGMGITLHALFEKLDADSPVSLTNTRPDLPFDEAKLLSVYRSLSPRGKELMHDRAEELRLLYGKKSEDQTTLSV